MPNKIKQHKLTMLKPRLNELKPRIKTLAEHKRTLKDKQLANGRTLALNSKAWSNLRSLVISEQPLCADCGTQGRITPGNEVDHIDNDASNNERSNLVNLCHNCHSAKTQRVEHYKRTGVWLPIKGCDINGIPLDPNHPWRIAANARKSPERQDAEPTVSLYAHDRTLGFGI